MIPWYIASLLSNACIMFVEYINRETDGTWLDALPYTLAPIVVAQWALFVCFNGAPHWLTAWAMFTIGNSVMRVASVNWFAGHEVTNWWVSLAGIIVMMGGAFLVKTGLR